MFVISIKSFFPCTYVRKHTKVTALQMQFNEKEEFIFTDLKTLEDNDDKAVRIYNFIIYITRRICKEFHIDF